MLQEVLLQERIWQAVEVISYFNENPEAWELLREESKPNYMEYVEKNDSYFSVCKFPQTVIPSHKATIGYKEWVEHYNKLDADFAKTFSLEWMPITENFMTDMAFIDLSKEGLAFLLLGCKLDYFVKIVHPSLIQFVENHKQGLYEKEEKEEIISFNDTPDNNLRVIRTFAESWKKKDASLIEPYITSDFIYSSQWVLEGIKGKGEYINYLSGKFDTIKNTHSNIKVAIVPNKNSIFLCQDNNQTCVLQIDVQHGMAHSAIMCFPDLCNLIDLNDD